jgi:hippurate hydrolase
LPELTALYRELHQGPELSYHEKRTAARLAGRLRSLGFTVTERVGGYGVVGVLKNGPGKTLLLRTDMDALPVLEDTGLPYASKATEKDERGQPVPAMHACGHDFHMSAWVGAATLLSRMKDRWKGTLIMIGQPAEETGQGAAGMLKAGLFTRFPRPDFALALHDSAELPAGKVGYAPGFAMAGVDSVDITVYGKGGHGAYPHRTIDPIVIAARTVVALQTVISRDKDPLEPGVITVGSIHGGTKHNIIPDEVRLQLTVRAYDDKVRDVLLNGIRRVALGEAAAAGAPRPPTVAVSETLRATYNDPAFTERVVAALKRTLGEANVVQMPPVMGAEDFGEFGRAGVPSLIFWLGASDPDKLEAARKKGEAMPSLHSPRFAPDVARALPVALRSLVGASLDILHP